MPLPIIKAATIAWRAKTLLEKHGGKIAHLNKAPVTAKALGESLKELREQWEDKSSQPLITMYNSIEVLVEIKFFMARTNKNLELDTSGMTTFQNLQAIVEAMEDKGRNDAVRDIRDTLDWSRAFFAREDVQNILDKTSLDTSLPKNLMDVPRFGKNLLLEITGEAKRIYDLVNAAKKPDPKGPSKPNDPNPGK
tara:strand:+ start:549 stop:1130 length:582 start_codon:yes stop_codon:yes gene_type:complete